MILSDDDRPVRIRPRKPRLARREGAAWAGAFRLVMHYARSTTKVCRTARGPVGGGRPRCHRCAVRVTYLANRTRGQWRAHGRYLARESAFANTTGAAGYNNNGDGIDVARELERWQSEGDPRVWKVILSPEFGDRMDLQRLARDLVEHMAFDLGTELEWIAVEHRNTEHPHIHMVLRGVGRDGEPLQFKREYVKHGIRGIAEDACTRQLGYRTSLDAEAAEWREIGEQRFTSLDRAILRDAVPGTIEANWMRFTSGTNLSAQAPDSVRRQRNHVKARLAVLQRMGLAEPDGPNSWRLSRDLEEVLRAMQRSADRQKTLAAHGVPISDDRLPVEVLDTRTFTGVEGRILVHGQDESSGRNYLMLEGTDAKIHFVAYTPEMHEARRSGGLRTNSFVQLRNLPVRDEPTVEIRDLGDADSLLHNRRLLEENARAFVKRGILPTDDGWGGWLGKYQRFLASAAKEILDREMRSAQSPVRNRDRSHGR